VKLLLLFYVFSNFLNAEQQLVASRSAPKASEVFLDKLANFKKDGIPKGCKVLGDVILTVSCALMLSGGSLVSDC
jgi:hypothetical protein